jgi:hypothetical protein
MDAVELRKLSKSVWTKRNNNGRAILVALDNVMQHTAEHRNWDILAEFMSASGIARPKIARIVSVAFGSALTFDKERAKKRKDKIAFSINWTVGENPLKGSNAYSVVLKAIENKKAFDAKDFQAELGKMLGSDKPEPGLIDKITAVLKYMEKAAKDFPAMAVSLEAGIKDMKAKLEIEKAKIEPDH